MKQKNQEDLSTSKCEKKKTEKVKSKAQDLLISNESFQGTKN